MSKLLIIEDSIIMQKVIRHIADSELDCDIDLAGSLAETKTLIAENDYYLALADLNLPDAPQGEVVDILLESNITTIVLTATLDNERRQNMLDKGVLDYIFKENQESYLQAVKLANQILNNQKITVLLADNSPVLRQCCRGLLEKMLFNLIEVNDGKQALAAFEQHSNIDLLITEYNLPEMNGIELIRQIRQSHSRDVFPIIGLSACNDLNLSAQFIKFGANDFLTAPFVQEEFQWRILRTMEQIRLISKITDSANRDFLTKLYNRRYFFSRAEQLYSQHQSQLQSQSSTEDLCISLIDIDFFKAVNDNYGHDSGDAVLVQIATLLKQHFSDFTVARYGGEEFIIILNNLAIEGCSALLEDFRSIVEAYLFIIPDGELKATVSLGAAMLKAVESLDEVINKADSALYKAKEAGRNQLIFQRNE